MNSIKNSFLFFTLVMSGMIWGQCKLKQPIISFSSSMTESLELLGLLQDPQLEAVSSFHPQKTSAKKIPGGLFVSQKIIQQFKAKKIFLDTSVEWEAKFKRLGFFVEVIETRQKDPFEIIESSVERLYQVTMSCEREYKKAFEIIQNDKKFLLSQKSLSGNFVFLLGAPTPHLESLLMMNHDGFLIWLRKNKKLSPPEWETPYLKWNRQQWKELGIQKIKIFIEQKDEFKMQKMEGQDFHLQGPGFLSPGWGQIQLMKKIYELVNTHSK